MFPGHKIIQMTETEIKIKYIPSHKKTYKLLWNNKQNYEHFQK